MCFLSHIHDSLFLNVFDPLIEQGKLFEKFITKVNFNKGSPDFRTFNLIVENVDMDEFGEVIFDLNAGFSMQPRGIFIYNLNHNALFNVKPNMPLLHCILKS